MTYDDSPHTPLGATDTANPQTSSDDGPSVPGLTVVVACVGFFLITLDATVVNLALPTISGQLHADTAALQWVVDAYTLVFAALMLSAGALSDRAGASRAFAQGVAAAAMLPASLALVRQTLTDPAARARGVAMWAAGGGAAVAAGPVVG